MRKKKPSVRPYEWVVSEYNLPVPSNLARGFAVTLDEAIDSAKGVKGGRYISVYSRPPLRHGMAASLHRADARRRWTRSDVD